ncbi:MAG: TlpA family protein disulfide reductase [Candidatus Acetothermia bacterium]|jgi:thiol-disulfide isomerase/thioredoxin|nr:TlpA family protein disulfide reductase [Candidatus Acetothermia bacterium]
MVSTGTEKLTLEQALRVDYQRKLVFVSQGLAEGDVAPPIAGVEFADGPSIVYHFKPPEEPAPAGVHLFPRVLRDWAETFVGLQIVLVVTGPTAEDFARDLRAIVGEKVTVVPDPFGKIRTTYELLDSPRGMLFLLNREGHIAGRAPGIRVENWHYLSQIVEVHARGEPSQTENMAFAVRHPKFVVGKPVPLAGLTDISGNPAPSGTFRGQVTMVYFFAPGCEPCAVATEVTKQLHKEFGHRVQFIGLAHLLSPDTIHWAHICATRYEEKESWAWSLPEGEEGARQYVEDTLTELKDYIAGFDFPVFVDWDDRAMGAWGMGLCGFPSWAILDSEGRLVEMIPGGAASYNLNGQTVKSTFPPVDWLQEMLNSALTAERSQ